MKVQLSIYNVHTKQKNVRFVIDENEKNAVGRIMGSQVTLEKEIIHTAFDIVLTEIIND